MSEKKFKEAKGNLAFSQGLLDRIGGQNVAQPQEMAQQSPEMPTQAPMEQPQQAPQEAPQPQPAPQPAPQPTPTTPEAPVEGGAGLLVDATNKIQEAFGQLTSFFVKNEENASAEVKKRDEKHLKELKGIKDQIKKIVEE